MNKQESNMRNGAQESPNRKAGWPGMIDKDGLVNLKDSETKGG